MAEEFKRKDLERRPATSSLAGQLVQYTKHGASLLKISGEGRKSYLNIFYENICRISFKNKIFPVFSNFPLPITTNYYSLLVTN